MKLPKVSIIIPTKNSARNLDACLLSLKHQTFPNIEIIVVDNHSTDGTVQIAKKYTKQVYTYGPERAAQVNFGVSKATGDYAYYTGSDITVEPDLVSQAVSTCEKENADAVYLNILTDIKHPNIWQKVRALERKCYFKEPGMSGARFWKKSVFIKLGGFTGQLGDEIEFQTRLDAAGYTTVFIDAKEWNHEEYASLWVIAKRSLYYGWLTKQARVKHNKIVRSELLRHRSILLQDPVVFFFFVLYKMTQYIAAGAGYTLALLMGYNTHIDQYLHRLNYG